MKTKRNRQNYPKEFRDDAVKLVIEKGYNCNEVARRLGINQTNVSRWVRQYRDAQKDTGEGDVCHSELEAENRRLHKENNRLLMEREILKKATAFFAKESS